MKRALALLLLCLGLPAQAAIETTTITGTVYAPDGSVATGGSITCALTPTPGRASDGVNLQVVASRYVATISGSGTVSFTLVPNDVISPAGTVYACTYTITGPLRSTFTESWSVTTAPDPVSIGAITRVGGPTLTLPTITGTANSMMASDGSGGLVSTPALQRAASGNALRITARYIEQDLTGTGTWITRTLGDVDGDGTLSFAKDIRPIIVADQALSARCDLTQDGTNESLCIKYVFPAGQYKFGFRDTVTLSKGGVVFEGSGEGSTLFQIVGACNGTTDYDGDGTVDSLEDGPTCVGGSVAGTACTSDANCTGGGACEDQQNYRSTFIQNASNTVFRGIGFDGGSNQFSFSQLATTDANYCDANDTDSDGSAVYPIGTDHCPCDPTRIAAPCTTYCSSNPATGSKAIGGACAQAGRTWCPNDEHFWFNSTVQTPPAENMIYTDNSFKRSDSNVWEQNDPVKGMLIARNRIYGSGEQSVQVYSESRIVDNYFEKCSGSVVECLTMTPVDYDVDGTYDAGDDLQNVVIANNVFKDCGGACIRNVAKPAGDMTLRNITIDSNIIDNTTLGSNTLGVINLQAASTGTRTWDNIAITNNTIVGGNMPANLIQLSPAGGTTARFNNLRISGNRISGSTPNTTGARSGIYVQYATGAELAGNVFDLLSDATVTGGNETQCIAVYDSIGAVLAHNECKVGGAGGVQGFNLAGLSDSLVTSNLFNFAGLTLTASAEYGIVLQTSGTTTTRTILSGNYLRGGDLLVMANPATNCMIQGNYCYASAQCVYLNGGSTLANRVSGNTAYLPTSSPWFNNATAQRNLFDGNDCVDCGAGAAYGGWENPTTANGFSWVTDSDTNGTLDATAKMLFGGATSLCTEGTTYDGIQSCDDWANPTTANKTRTKPDRSGTYALYSTNALDLQKTDAPVTCAAGTEGYVYYDDSLNEVCFCNGTNWVTVDGTGGTPSAGGCG